METAAASPSPHDRILVAADDIIRRDGMDELTMRRLADTAGVALKTPYNVFGSKTGVLIALLDRVNQAMSVTPTANDSELFVEGLLATLEETRRFYGRDEAYYRSIFWEIMISDHPEAKTAAHGNIIGIGVRFLEAAYDAGELKPNSDPVALGTQLGLSLLANMGIWAGGQLSIADTMAHTRLVWISLLLTASADDTGDVLQTMLGEP